MPKEFLPSMNASICRSTIRFNATPCGRRSQSNATQQRANQFNRRPIDVRYHVRIVYRRGITLLCASLPCPNEARSISNVHREENSHPTATSRFGAARHNQVTHTAKTN
ncbi:MAG: hypothetical protein KDA63_16890 [Planctomycetales bacterium]|nr:hypothetical protein [Planctomycetales bacterium]